MQLHRFADTHRLHNPIRFLNAVDKAPLLREINQRPAPCALLKGLAACSLEDVEAGVVVEVARTEAAFVAARGLVEQRYTARGYKLASDEGRPVEERNAVTLLARAGDEILGTMTLRLDAGEGLQVENAYGAEVRTLRNSSGLSAEMTCLALSQNAEASHAVLAVLFRFSYFIMRTTGVSDLFIEVNPRHALFYRRALGFSLAAEERICPRVQAPAVLLHIPVLKLGARLGEFSADETERRAA